MIGGDRGDRLTVVAHDVAGEHRLISMLETVERMTRHVLVRERATHARYGERGSDIEAHDARRRMRRAQGLAPQHAVGPQVGAEREATLRLGDAVGPRRALADPRWRVGVRADRRHV